MNRNGLPVARVNQTLKSWTKLFGPSSRSVLDRPGRRTGTHEMELVPTRYQTEILTVMDVLIRDLPNAVHAELARRAAANDMSLRAYLRAVLSDHVAVPSMADWLQHVRDLGPAHDGVLTGAELVAAARAEDDGLVNR